MNIFDAEYNTGSMKGYNTSETDHQAFNKESCSFEYMFNTNSFYNSHTNNSNTFSYGSLKDNEANSFNSLQYEPSVGSPSLNDIQRASPFTMNDNIFSNHHQPQSWGREWSDGRDSQAGSTQSSVTQSVNSFGMNDNFDGLLSSSPQPQQQSRIMNYISATSPASNPVMSPTNKIESMKVRDFLNHPANTLASLETSPSLPSEPPSNVPANGDSESFFTDFLHGPFNSLFLNEENRKVSNESSEFDDKPVNVWDSLNNIRYLHYGCLFIVDNLRVTTKILVSRNVKYNYSNPQYNNKLYFQC